MKRQRYNIELIQGLWKIRNKYPETRDWLRQCIRYERHRRTL